ncbi:hypothetical protein BC936DRAFT_137431 [Jimgerdemannia flammicorona]|uniref:Uncharacterized protein n=2 Tax=Jimgerdemannia flammicorona TaxID=994334 RepID=A0A433CXF0_9FUNG|nr:hypothetical protein BC936DRAFT_137431 [Jimgerdemannia flammicorona]RUS27029.1 hypothetical protein BC938DRAFT_483809 [Jimgerdemannia flammicorona]
MAPTSINTLLSLFKKNGDTRYSYASLPHDESDSDDDGLLDVVSNDGSMWQTDEIEKPHKMARYCCGLMFTVVVIALVHILLGLLLLSEVMSRFPLDKQIKEFKFLLKTYHPIVRDSTPFLQYGKCPSTEIEWAGRSIYETDAKAIFIRHSGNTAVSYKCAQTLGASRRKFHNPSPALSFDAQQHGKLTVKQGDVNHTTVLLNILLSSDKLKDQLAVSWDSQEDYGQMDIIVPSESGWNTNCIQLDIDVVIPRNSADDVSLDVSFLPDHSVVVDGEGLRFSNLSIYVGNGNIMFTNTMARSVIAETWNGAISGLLTLSQDLYASVANGAIDLGVDISPSKNRESVNIDARAWLNGPVSLNLTNAWHGYFALDTSFIAETHVEHELQDLQQDVFSVHDRVGYKGGWGEKNSGKVHMKSLTDDVTLRFVEEPVRK